VTRRSKIFSKVSHGESVRVRQGSMADKAWALHGEIATMLTAKRCLKVIRCRCVCVAVETSPPHRIRKFVPRRVPDNGQPWGEVERLLATTPGNSVSQLSAAASVAARAPSFRPPSRCWRLRKRVSSISTLRSGNTSIARCSRHLHRNRHRRRPLICCCIERECLMT